MNMAMIKELRERTGVGFGDCKKALVEADWDMARAVDIVRLQSGAKAEKKADRTAAEGLLGLKVEDGKGAMVEINIETDFAARNPRFSAFVERAVDTVLSQGADDVAAALETNRQALVQEVGENINVRRAVRVDAPAGATVAGYLHQDGKKGALVAVSGGAPELGRDLAMHVTAMRPLVLSPDDMPADVVAKERALYEEQTAQEQAQSDKPKPAQIVERIIAGRVRKFLAESSLLEQPFVKDTNIRVRQLLANAQATCTTFERFEVGEGIERREEDFAAEVRKQLS